LIFKYTIINIIQTGVYSSTCRSLPLWCSRCLIPKNDFVLGIPTIDTKLKVKLLIDPTIITHVKLPTFVFNLPDILRRKGHTSGLRYRGIPLPKNTASFIQKRIELKKQGSIHHLTIKPY